MVVAMGWLTVTEYFCHEWPWICYACRNHSPEYSTFTFYRRTCYKSNTMGGTSGGETAYPSGTPEGLRVFCSMLRCSLRSPWKGYLVRLYSHLLCSGHMFYLCLFVFIFILVSNTPSMSDDVHVVRLHHNGCHLWNRNWIPFRNTRIHPRLLDLYFFL